MADILDTLDAAWNEDFKTNLMHYCDLAAQEIRKLRKELDERRGEVVETQDRLGALLHAAEADAQRWKAAYNDAKSLANLAIVR